MLKKLKLFFIMLISYFKPVQLGNHVSTDTALYGKSVDIDTVIGNCIQNNTIVSKDTRSSKSESISFNEPIQVSLDTNAQFEMLGIVMSRTGSSKSTVRVRHKKTKQVFRISMNTFKALFVLKKSCL